jgi:Domain of unknown function (DUF1929)
MNSSSARAEYGLVWAGSRWALCGLAAAVLAACGGGSTNSTVNEAAQSADTSEDGGNDAVDYGWGAGPSMMPMREQMKIMGDAGTFNVPYKPTTGGPQAAQKGAFGPAFPWPVIPLHMVVLPDGKIMAYGSDEQGNQTGEFTYTVWNPDWQTGSGGSAFDVLDNTTGSDIFCSTQLLLPQTGNVLLVGGDLTVNGVRNYAIKDINLFNPITKTLTKQPAMKYRRWYATAVTTATGEQVILGGRDSRDWAGGPGAPKTTATYPTTPEVYNRTTGWRTLTGVTSNEAWGTVSGNWWYPQAWLAPNGRIVSIGHSGNIYSVNPAGTGTLTKLPGKLVYTNQNTSSVMYAPGKILSLRNGTNVQLVDLNGANPVVTNGAKASIGRRWGLATVLADGTVWANGGSTNGNVLADAIYTTELWNPATGTWKMTANATKPRLYHGNAILMQDGSVLTGGGGAPGPVANLNGEVYYPPYFFNADGSFAVRPTISTISTRNPALGQVFNVGLGSTAPISKVTLVRSGSSTHSFNNEQRFQTLAFTQTGAQLKVTAPADVNRAPPGYYMVFVFNQQGVPSRSEIIRVGS